MRTIHGRINVQFREPLDWVAVEQTIGRYRIDTQTPPLRLFTIAVNEVDGDAVLAELQASPYVEFADFDCEYEGDYLSHPATNDTYVNDLYTLKRMATWAAHRYQKGSPSVRIGIIDSGLDMSHGEFSGRAINGFSNDPIARPWNNPQTGGTSQIDHGTNVTSCIAPRNNNGAGVAGIAPDVDIFMLRTSWAMSDVINLIYTAMGHDIDILSMSISWQSGYSLVNDAVSDWLAQGGLFVHSAGNSNTASTFGPYVEGILHVASIDRFDNKSWYSCYGPSVNIVAPGQTMWVATLNNSYVLMSGTSYSTPYVAGVAGLVKSENGNLSASQIKQVLLDTTDTILSVGVADYFGNAGCVNALKAVLKAKSLRPENAGKLYPYIQLFGPDVSTTISNSSAITVPSGRVVMEAGVYGQEWNESGIIEVWIDGVKVYEGLPFKPSMTNAAPSIKVETSQEISASVVGQYDIFTNDGTYFGKVLQSGQNGTFTFSVTKDLTGIDLLTFENDRGIEFGSTYEATLGGNTFEFRKYGGGWDKVYVDVHHLSGQQTLQFTMTLSGEEEYFIVRNVRYYAAPLYTSSVVWDFDGEPIKVVAKHGDKVAAYEYPADLTPPQTKASLSGSRVTLEEAAFDQTGLDKIYYRVRSHEEN